MGGPGSSESFMSSIAINVPSEKFKKRSYIRANLEFYNASAHFISVRTLDAGRHSLD